MTIRPLTPRGINTHHSLVGLLQKHVLNWSLLAQGGSFGYVLQHLRTLYITPEPFSAKFNPWSQIQEDHTPQLKSMTPVWTQIYIITNLFIQNVSTILKDYLPNPFLLLQWTRHSALLYQINTQYWNYLGANTLKSASRKNVLMDCRFHSIVTNEFTFRILNHEKWVAMVTVILEKSISRITTEVVTELKAGFHMIANDRRRSQRELFPYNRRRSQTIAEPTVAIHFVQRKCQMYSRVVFAGKSKQKTWRTSRGKFCCKQSYFFF